MIALAILGIGLLVIAAALPAGVRLTQQSADMATGLAATEYALDVIERSVCLREQIVDGNQPSYPLARPPAMFQPRVASLSDPNHPVPPWLPGELIDDHEPVVKVRPLFTQNIDAKPGSSTWGQAVFGSTSEVWVEDQVRNWLGNCDATECDPAASQGPWIRPALPSVAMAYPPIESFDRNFQRPRDFTEFVSKNDPNTPLPVWLVGVPEARKVMERRVVWNAFYRRASYAPGSDPCVYEIVVVASRLPSPNHRFPVQNPIDGGGPGSGITAGPVGKSQGDNGATESVGDTPAATGASGYWQKDTAAPIPWLVSFDTLPVPPLSQPSDPNSPFQTGFVPPATLTFVATESVAAMLPPGSIFVPAVNDRAPGSLPGGPRAGFAPLAPDVLPIYEVVRRDPANGKFNIVVNYNGFYPWTLAGGSTGARHWPVWIVPPPIESVTGSPAVPVFPDKSEILAVSRRYITLREVP